MKEIQEAVHRRRTFLKSTGGAALAFLATSNAHGENSHDHAAIPKGRFLDQPRDLGLWATWYDLPANGREAYLSWLHGTYLPQLLKRPGYMWAAHYASRDNPSRSDIRHVDDPEVPTGFHYILLIGVKDPFVLGNPSPRALHAALPEQDRKMLAMRVGERVNLLAETGRYEGRARKTYKDGLTSAPCVQIGSFNCPLAYEESLHAGYVKERLPAMCDTASSIRMRKLNSVVGWAKHVIIYEFASQEGFDRDYVAASAKAPLMQGNIELTPKLLHAPSGPNSALRIWPPVSKT